ncbi:MAG: SAM-dependent methyltransferase, partial [Mollicutes bacterium]|nr:SAM-dependent methyltransferase [Mollicutes bacterium]
MIKLSKRLLEIVNHLDFKEKVLDVGCDHGKLAIYLILNNHYNNINVSDNKLSALNQAIKNIEDYNLKDKITYHLGEGIEFIDNLDLDT